MKFIKKADENFVLKNLFNEHINKFNLKNDQELIFLEDIRNFIEKKCQMELQYSQSLSKLCNQYLNKSEYQIINETNSQIYILEKWKLLLEQYAYIAEKKQVSSQSLLMHCDYFKKIKEQKNNLNQISLNYLKKLHEILDESHKNCENAFKSYCMDQYLCDQLDKNTKITNSNLEKKLKARNINVTKFKKTSEEMLKNEQIANERKKKLDFSKLNYVTANCCQNQQLQYYFSMEIPQLLQLQNGCLDGFIEENINTLAFKELESSKFLIRQFEDSILNIVENTTNTNTDNISQIEERNLNQIRETLITNNNSSEAYFIDKQSCFYNLIQFDLQPHDTDFQPSFFSFQKDNIKNLSSDYIKWSNKLNELETLMKTMLAQVNEKQIEMINNGSSIDENETNSKILQFNKSGLASSNGFVVDLKREQQRFLISEKKFQMIQLQAKIDALGSFNINLDDLDSYNNAAKFESNRTEFESNLHQNLELWDVLMRSIDEMHFSDDSYDVDYVRKTSKDFNDSDNSNHSPVSMSIFEPNYYKEKNLGYYYSTIPDIEPRYAKTVNDYVSIDKDYLSYKKDQSLIIYDQVFAGIYRAKNYLGLVGLINSNDLEFYKDEPVYVKSVHVYDGLDEQELSFPSDSYIRLLRKNLDNRKVDDEEWWEGAYDSRIGFFPAIFVREIDKFETSYSEKEIENDLKIDNLMISSPIKNATENNNNNNNNTQVFSPFTENQKVPQ